ncbi:MAG: peptide chain release factor 1 [Magnetococcales bacterium]|nr:peptide chain release factor 1 [Magnetococcales bacterium]
MSFLDKLKTLQRRHAELSALLGQPETMADSEQFTRYSKEYSDLDPVVEAFNDFQNIETQKAEAEAMLAESESDQEMRQMAKDELEYLKDQVAEKWRHLQIMLLPKDPNENKNVILEIRAGTGGDEAGLFAGDLFRMYTRYAENHNWKIEILSSSPTALGGFKEVVAMLTGKGAFAALKFESGTHRVQRVPTTEAGGRIHTSACTVAILPEADEVDIKINEKEDLRIDVFRASGPGGQSVNTTDSAIRITHIPTGLVVICQDEKSQLKNKAQALKVLKARLYDQEQQALDDERSQERKGQVGSGDRSERIRTYNFPQNRMTDHRINLTLHKLDAIIQGDLTEMISALTTQNQADQLAQLGDL